MADDFKFFGNVLRPAGEVRVEVTDDKDGDRVFVFGPMDTATYRKYNDLLFGQGGRRKGNSWKAVQYLFGEKCARIEGLTEQEESALASMNKTLQEVMLADFSTYGWLIDQVTTRYSNVVMPDMEGSKST
jgi:hypothetical protein